MTSADHAGLHDLRLDLAEAGLQASLARALRDQDAGRAHQRIDDVAHAQEELLHAPAHAGADDGLVQLHLGLGQLGFGAGLLGREHGRDPRSRPPVLRPRRQRRRPGRPPRGPASFSMSRSGTMPGLRRCSSCLVSSSSMRLLERALGLPDLAFRLQRHRLSPPPAPPRSRRSCAARSRPRPPASNCRA